MTNAADSPTDTIQGTAEEARLTRKERRLSVLLSALAFFVSYVLSAGPAVFMVKRFDLPMIGTIVKVLYAPLVLLVKLRIPLISSLIEAWVGLFR